MGLKQRQRERKANLRKLPNESHKEFLKRTMPKPSKSKKGRKK